MEYSVPHIGPFEINSAIYPMGDAPMNSLIGRYYVENDQYLVRAGYLDYALYYSEWSKPSCLDYKYQPDAYDYLINGESAVEHTTPYQLTESSFNLIETKGGFEEYLSRLKSKKRSELRKINTLKVNIGNIISDTDAPNVNICQYLDWLLKAELLREETKTIDEWFGQGFTTTKAPLMLMLYVGMSTTLNRFGTSGIKRVILPIQDGDGNLVCNTLCLSMHNSKFLYAICDVDKTESYSAKAVTIANIEWAANNGYDYVDIDNGILTEDRVADETVLVRTAYKTIFYTGKAAIPCYFDSEETKSRAFEENPDSYSEPQ